MYYVYPLLYYYQLRSLCICMYCSSLSDGSETQVFFFKKKKVTSFSKDFFLSCYRDRKVDWIERS